MNKINKYIIKTINYNLIPKINCINIEELNNKLPAINLIIKDKFINNKYNTLLNIFYLLFITNKKSNIIKNKKDNLYLNLRKNDNIGIKLLLRKNNLWEFYIKIFNKYFNILNANSVLNHDFYSNNSIQFVLPNVNKIDSKLLKEYMKLHSFDIIVSFILNKSINITKFNLLLSHLNFIFIYDNIKK